MHQDPGCEDPVCCERVGRLDGYCDGATWHQVCVDRALAFCALSPCTLTVPPEAIPEAELCYKHLNDGAAYGGATIPIACGQTYLGECATGSPRDTDWYALGTGGPRRIRFTSCASRQSMMSVLRRTVVGVSVPSSSVVVTVSSVEVGRVPVDLHAHRVGGPGPG